MSLGMGVMFGMLTGNAGTVEAINRSLNKTIKEVRLFKNDHCDELILTLDDGTLLLRDSGQSCCEFRYMTCDDDLPTFAGSKIVGVELRDAPSIEDGGYGGDHDVQFLVVRTTGGEIVCSTHNEHNGYYGGFNVVADFAETT